MLTIMYFFWSGFSPVAAAEQPSGRLEYTLPDSRLKFTLPDSRLKYTATQ